MIQYEIINQKSWEIAAKCIIKRNRDYETYSKGQIRRILELAKTNSFENDIKSFIEKYTPQPSSRQKEQKQQAIAEDLKKMKLLNENVARDLLFLKDWDSKEIMKFSQYLMWDLRIIQGLLKEDDGIDKLKLVLECEKVKDQKLILDILTGLLRTNYTDRTQRKRELGDISRTRRR